MFESYFQNFYGVLDQLYNLLRWQFFLIVNGCPCVLGPRGGGVIFMLFNLCKKTFKNRHKCFKKNFEMFFYV